LKQKNKKIPLEDHENDKKQYAKVTVKSKRGFADQGHFESDHNFDFTDMSASHENSGLSETSGSGTISGNIMLFSPKTEHSEESESDKILELQLEIESLKRQYRALVTKHEKEKRDLERSGKNLSEEKKKVTRNSEKFCLKKEILRMGCY